MCTKPRETIFVVSERIPIVFLLFVITFQNTRQRALKVIHNVDVLR